MSEFDWFTSAPADGLADLIGGLGSGIHDVADGIQGGIDAMVNTAAVGLLNSVLPPMVHAKNAVIRSSSWVSVEAGTVEVASHVAGVTIGNTVLAGLVAKKVEEGIGTITSNLDYMHGVNSIT